MSSRLEQMLVERMPREVVAAYREVMSREYGRTFVAYLLSQWGWRAFDPAIKEGSCSSLHTVFVDGMQETARRLEYEAKTNFPELLRMMRRELDARDERYEKQKREQETTNDRAED